MAELRWEQVHAWRLAQHALLDRSDQRQMLDVVAQICGVQAQVMSGAEAVLKARIPGVSSESIRAALWQDRTLVKTWVMRGTLHLIRSDDLPLFTSARSAHPIRRPPSYYQYHGVTPDELEAIIEGVPATLTDAPMTREQLADALAARSGNPKLRDVLLSGWGALLKPSAFRGDLCFGPNQGQHVTFVRPDRWLGGWQEIDPAAALQEVARRYLAAYGPATSDDFARWWGTKPPKAKQLFRQFGNEIAAVEVDGWSGWALQATIEEMRSQAAGYVVRLLPAFDPYTIALSRQPGVLDPSHLKRVSRPQGWIAPVVLIGGRIAGVWKQAKERDHAAITVTMFDPPSAKITSALEAEADRIGAQIDIGHA